MAPAATLSARQSVVTVVAGSGNTNLSTGAITGIILVSLFGGIGIITAIWAFRRRRKRARDATPGAEGLEGHMHSAHNLQVMRSAESMTGGRNASYERAVNAGRDHATSAGTPHSQTERSFELSEENLRRATLTRMPEPAAVALPPVAGIHRTGQSEFALDASGSAFESIAFPDDVSMSRHGGQGHRGRQMSRPSKSTLAAGTGKLPTHVENTNRYERSEFWRDGVDEVEPDQSISNMLNRRQLVRKPAPLSTPKRNGKGKYIMSEREAEKAWNNEISKETSRHSPSIRSAPRSPRPIRPASPLNESAEARIARLERDIANLIRGERITREAEIELAERRPSDLPVYPKERSRTANWIHTNTKPAHPTTLPDIPVGNDGFDTLTDITTRSALEFPRPGESSASALSESACLTNDIWRQEVLKNKASRNKF